jgi:UDP-glucose 4-epimerase
MKAIVTGGNGFIGSHMVDFLVEKGWEVVVIDDNSAECNSQFYYNDKAQNHKINICDYDAIEPLFENADYVFHMAAESRIQPSILNPVYAAKVNVEGTCCVLQAARKKGVKRVVYSGTSSAYGLKNQPPLSETMPNDCLNPYSVTKCGGEELCKMYSKLFGLDTTILRYFNVYGVRSPLKGQYAPVVGLFFKQYFSGQDLTVVGDGLQRRDFTHVQDVVMANYLAATHDEKLNGEIFNIGSGTNISVIEIANIISDKIVHIPPREGEARETLANIDKVTSTLNWKPTIPIEEWLEKEKENPSEKYVEE